MDTVDKTLLMCTQCVLLTGSHTEIPLEPKKCSLPNTTTAVCQIPSIRFSVEKKKHIH